MKEIISCPSCQKKLQLPEEYLGKTVQCPGCKSSFTAQRGGRPEQDAGPPPEEEEPRARRRRPDYDDEDEADDYEDDYGERRRRRRRRDLAPHRGGAILTLGILSLLFCGLLGIVAWIMGNNDLAEIRAGRMDPSGEGTTQAGRICGIIGVVWIALVVVSLCLVLGVASLNGPGRRF